MTFLHTSVKFSIGKREIEQKALHMLLDHFEICLGCDNVPSSIHSPFKFLCKQQGFSYGILKKLYPQPKFCSQEVLDTHLHSETVLYSSKSHLLHILLHCFYKNLQASSLWDQILSYCVHRVLPCTERLSQAQYSKCNLKKINIKNHSINPGGLPFAGKQEVKQRIPWPRNWATLHIC